MRINVAVPEANVQPEVLDAALEAVTRLNEDLISKRQVPTFAQALEQGIQWRPEPPGQEHFDHAAAVIGRGWGDCDDLAPFQAASLRATGEDPDARAVVVQSGPKRWHAVVERGDGSHDDPSADAGMHEWYARQGTRGATVPMISTRGESSVVGAYRIRPQIALRPAYGVWQARADLPWHWREHEDQDAPTRGDFAMAALHASPVASTAIVGCINGLVDLADTANFGDEEHIERLMAIADHVDGADYWELVDEYGPEHAAAAVNVVGSFWGSLKNIAKAALPVVSKAVQFIPGVGPVASTALDVASTLIPGDRPKSAPVAPVGPPGLAALQSSGRRSGQLCIPATFG